MATLKSRQTSYGYLTLEDTSTCEYVIKLNGQLYRGTYKDKSDAEREFDSLPN